MNCRLPPLLLLSLVLAVQAPEVLQPKEDHKVLQPEKVDEPELADLVGIWEVNPKNISCAGCDVDKDSVDTLMLVIARSSPSNVYEVVLHGTPRQFSVLWKVEENVVIPDNPLQATFARFGRSHLEIYVIANTRRIKWSFRDEFAVVARKYQRGKARGNATFKRLLGGRATKSFCATLFNKISEATGNILDLFESFVKAKN